MHLSAPVGAYSINLIWNEGEDMKKRFIAFVAVLMLVVSLSAPAYADFSAADAQNSVAVIATMLVEVDDSQMVTAGYGSCFFVGEQGKTPEYLLTNYHVIEDYLLLGKGELFTVEDDGGEEHVIKMILRVYFASNNDYMEAYLVDYDEGQDIALLRLSHPTEKRMPLKLCVPTEDMVGETMYSVGYPLYSDSIILDPDSYWGKNDSLVVKGTVGRLVTSSGSGTKWLQIGDTVWASGNSGGPVIVDDMVIGLVTGGYTVDGQGADMYYVANIERAVELLNNHDIKFDLVSSSFDLMKWLPYIGVGAAVVIIAVVLMIVIKKRKRAKAIIKSREEAQRLLDEQERTKEKTPYIRSLSDQHGGGRVVIRSPYITVGRNPSCAVVFRENTPGVSGNHCIVAFDKDTSEFILTDQSTYGTFLATGQRIKASVPYRLRAGEQFYLGEPANSMRFELE